jgi:hypothetical protein
MIDPSLLTVITKFNFLKFLKPQRLQYYFQKCTEVRPPIFGEEKVQYARPVARPLSNMP